jgi:hypothetical protein
VGSLFGLVSGVDSCACLAEALATARVTPMMLGSVPVGSVAHGFGGARPWRRRTKTEPKCIVT